MTNQPKTKLQVIEIPKYKKCCVCKLDKKLAEFYKTKQTLSGLSFSCRVCSRIRCKKYNEKNKIILSKFDLSDREQFLEAVNYKNLQPLWAYDNLRKGNRY